MTMDEKGGGFIFAPSSANPWQHWPKNKSVPFSLCSDYLIQAIYDFRQLLRLDGDKKTKDIHIPSRRQKNQGQKTKDIHIPS
ncbi:MAG: hypothetical protein IIB68_11985 [Proteobacteria bacterium]|nr:hypothetical protein [Pseudomonadota bacterium]